MIPKICVEKVKLFISDYCHMLLSFEVHLTLSPFSRRGSLLPSLL